MAIAKRITSEELTLNLILNIDKVQNSNNKLLNDLYRLDRQTRELENKYMQLNLAKKNLSKSSATYSQDLRRIEKEMASVRRQIELNRAQMNEWRKQIGAAGLTINQLRSHLAALRIQRDNATDPRTIRLFNAEIKKTQLQLERMTTGMSRMAQAWQRMGAVANRFGTITGWIMVAIYGLGRAVNSTVRNMRELDKQFSNVMKVSGLTREEMQRLKREYDQLGATDIIKTPTKTTELLEISRIAGRLGVRGVEDIRDFTLAVDKLYVALGEDMKGTVEEVAEKVGKLVNVFQLDKELGLSEAMLRAGSLINELGKSSAAQAETVLNYTARLGGVGSMAKFTIDQLAGLGASLDAMNVPAERGSTALVKLITSLGQNVEQFSRLLGMSVEDYSRWVAEDINAVLLAMLEATTSGNDSIVQVIQSMDAMDVSGVRVAEVFGKLSQNLEFVKQQQDIAAKAFSSSASVMNEFYIMSGDWNSLLAIQGKRIKALADDYSKAMTPSLYKAYKALIDFLYAMRDGLVWLDQNLHIIAGITAAIGLLKATQIGLFIQKTVRWIIYEIGYRKLLLEQYWKTNSALVSMRNAYVAAGAGAKGAAAAVMAFGKALFANPYTAAVAVVLSLAAAFFLTRQRVDEVKKAMNDLTSEIDTQTRHMQQLFLAAQKANDGSAERANAIRTINNLFGQYLPNLLSEQATVQQIGEAYDYANQKLSEQIALKFKNDRYDQIIKKNQENRNRKQERLLGPIKDSMGPYAFGQANFELDKSLARLSQMTDTTAVSVVVTNFLKKWGLENQASRKAFLELIELRKSELDLETKLAQSVDGYINSAQAQTNTYSNGSGSDWQAMSEADLESEKQRLKNELTLQRTSLSQKFSDKDEYRQNDLKAEAQYLQSMLELTRRYYSNDKGEMLGGATEIIELEWEIEQNRRAQAEAMRKDSVQKEKETWKEEIRNTYTEIENEYSKAYLAGEISKRQFDDAMLALDLEYKRNLLAETRSRGEETVELEKEIWDMRIKQQESMASEAAQINATIAELLHANYKQGETADPYFDEETQRIADRLVAQRKRIRQFMGLDKDEELEGNFGVFETSNFEDQFSMLDDWLKQGVITHEEYERRKTDITREQTKTRAKIAKEGLDAVNDMLNAYGQLNRARMDAELQKAGDNELKKEKIRKEYGEREKKVSNAQAIISGALAIMRILEGKITGNPLVDTPIKGALIAATVATTGMQLAAISAQQFAKGSYPVTGADDKRTYNAEFVGSPRTGIYRKPSLGLFAEKPEMVIDWPTLKNIQFNSPSLIDAIMAHRYPGGGQAKQGTNTARQYATGNYPSVGQAGTSGQLNEMVERMANALEENNELLRKLENWKPTVYTELIKKDLQTLDDIQKYRGM